METRRLKPVLLCLVLAPLLVTTGFTVTAPHCQSSASVRSSFSSSRQRRHRFLPICRLLPEDDDDDEDLDFEDEDDDEDIDISDKDWRAFRAKLVMSEGAAASTTTSTDEANDSSTTIIEDEDDLDGIGAIFGMSSKKKTSSSSEIKLTPLDPSQWAYDSGKVIEKGAVILGGVEQAFGFGLRQQYFHKAAILVLDHDEKFTRGIILNRPSDLLLDDDINDGVKWRVWFGGDVQGLHSPNAEIVCLHSLQNEQVGRASIPVMKDIQWTTFENAKRLVQLGAAQATDFWLFAGYAGWGPGQLMGELDRKSWYMVATDSQTLLKELAQTGTGADPRDAGLDTWNLLMNMIGREETAKINSGGFDDLMLKEWAHKNLLSIEAGGGADVRGVALPMGLLSAQQQFMMSKRVDMAIDEMVKRAQTTTTADIAEGSLVRASSQDRSPFLLSDQELHKSVVLIVMDNVDMTVGVILNRLSAKGLDIQIKQSRVSRTAKTIKMPMRYGGQYAIKGTEPLLWLHCGPRMKSANIGTEVGNGRSGIWKCTKAEVATAIGQQLAVPDDFIVVSGAAVWTKGEIGLIGGMEGEIQAGRFEVVPASLTEGVWQSLLQQRVVLDKYNFDENLLLASDAWRKGTNNGKEQGKTLSQVTKPMGGLGENFDEEDDTLVFKSDVKVADLSDKALKSWVAAFLLGEPGMEMD